MKKLFLLAVNLLIINELATSQSVTLATSTTNPTKGTVVYNNGTNQLQYWNGTAWIPITNAAAGTGWALSGTNIYNSNTRNVGIGTSNPLNKLHIKQNITNAAIEWEHESLTNRWSIGIGTSTFNCRFEFNDALRSQISSVDGTFVVGSDFQLKQEIEPISDLLQKTMLLKPNKYFYKSSRNIAKNKSIGFIAQDVEKIFPEIVYDSDDGLKGLNYAAFGVIAIKAIQEQQEIINNLQEKLFEQEKNNLKLEAQFKQIQADFSAILEAIEPLLVKPKTGK